MSVFDRLGYKVDKANLYEQRRNDRLTPIYLSSSNALYKVIDIVDYIVDKFGNTKEDVYNAVNDELTNSRVVTEARIRNIRTK